MYAGPVDFGDLPIKVHGNLADTYDGLGMTLRPADDSVDPRDQLDLM